MIYWAMQKNNNRNVLTANQIRQRLCYFLSAEYYEGKDIKEYNKADLQSCIKLLMTKRYKWKHVLYFLNQYEKVYMLMVCLGRHDR